jgi:methionine biosynthesis protein MetW
LKSQINFNAAKEKRKNVNIDHLSVNDNRQYDFTHYPDEERKEYNIISGLIQNGATVVDLGYGNGSLLVWLQKDHSARIKGVELSPSGIQACQAKELDVVQSRIDEHNPFEDNSFDYAVCNVTIQMVMYPEVFLSEMKRIARYQIISFPNFAFYRNRIQFVLSGKMPTHMLFGYQWYSTGHIHQLSLKDFKNLVYIAGGLEIRELHCVGIDNFLKKFFMQNFPNLFMHIPIMLLEKNG